MKMLYRLTAGLLAAALALPGSAAPKSAAAAKGAFPTSGRVEYVLECMQKHDGKYEYLYKCSCAIDAIAQQLNYDDFVTMSTALRSQSLSGPQGAEFRDPESVKAMANKYKAIQAAANQACFVS